MKSTATNDELQLVNSRDKLIVECGACYFKKLYYVRAVGDAMIICSPLVISHSEINELIEKVKLCLDLTWEKINS